MGRRSRKRSLSGAGPPRPAAGDDKSARPATSRAERDAERRRLRASGEARAPAARRGSRRRTGERPQAPWGTFPLTELVVLVAIVLGIAGLVIWGLRGQIMLLAGFALGSLAGLELAVREHFAGYRSHTTLLSASGPRGPRARAGRRARRLRRCLLRLPRDFQAPFGRPRISLGQGKRRVCAVPGAGPRPCWRVAHPN